MLKRYTIHQGTTSEHIVTECEHLLSPSVMQSMAQDCWQDGDYAGGNYYAQLAWLGQPVWELVWTEQDFRHAIPPATVKKLLRRGRWPCHIQPPTAAGRNWRYVYLVCEY